MSNDLGKVRPSVVVQKTDFIDVRDNITICPFTTTITKGAIVRPTIQPSQQNNIQQTSQIMVDRLCSIDKKRIKSVIGSISQNELNQLDEALKLWLDL